MSKKTTVKKTAKTDKPVAAKAAAPAAPTPPTAKDQRNGVTRPKAGSICASIWDACDTLKGEGKDTTFDALKALLPKMNDATIRTQRQRHKTFSANA